MPSYGFTFDHGKQCHVINGVGRHSTSQLCHLFVKYEGHSARNFEKMADEKYYIFSMIHPDDSDYFVSMTF